MPTLTRDQLEQALNGTTHNTCAIARVHALLDEEGRAVLDEALAIDHKRLPATHVREMLIEGGVAEKDIPNVRQIQNHRGRRESCKCQR